MFRKYDAGADQKTRHERGDYIGAGALVAVSDD
jgi:hypothetical protein